MRYIKHSQGIILDYNARTTRWTCGSLCVDLDYHWVTAVYIDSAYKRVVRDFMCMKR